MANSVVKVTDATDDAISDSLLLLVGEDGTVTPDRQTVDKYLNSKSGPTSLQIMHIDKCDQKGIDVTVDNVMYIPDNMEAQDVKDDVSSVIANLHHVRLDHDYTPLTSPRRPGSSAEDDDELAKTLSIIHGSESQPATSKSTVSTIASNTTTKTTKSINIISSFTIPPTTSQGTASSAVNQKLVEKKPVETPQAKLKGKAKILHTSPKKKGRGRPPKNRPSKAEPAEENDNEDEEVNEELSQDEDEESEDEEYSLAIEDDQNDSDFDLEQEITGKKGKRASKRVREEDKRKKLPSESQKESKTPKTAKKSKKKSVSLDDEPNVTEKPEDNKEQSSNEPERLAEVKPEVHEQKEKNEDKPDEAKNQDKKPKKKKEPPKPIPGDFALFSTPDIIRKVGGKEPSTPEVAPTTPKSLKPGEHSKCDTPVSKPGKITHESRSKSVTEAGLPSVKHDRLSLDEKDKGHQQRVSTEAKVKDRRDSVDKHKHKSVDEKSGKPAGHHHDRRRSDSSSDSGRVHSKHEHHGIYEETPSNTAASMEIPSAEDIRAIIMTEDTKTYTTNTIPIPDVAVPMSDSPDTHTMSLDSSGLDLDQSLLDNISNDDVISEDILYQVAKQLVSNTELQNAIDKGINDGVLDTSSIQDVMDISNASQSANSSFSENQQSNIIKQGTQIVRPDGRVVVLPPIERPTTRSRNKRKEEVAKPSFKTVHKPLDDEHVSGNELDSSGEELEESEDDPNKLWCICNQPHNNRFMICCDTCEEWYHGKCVNITKAMGQQMESEGKEWICLFCKDPQLKRPLAAARRIRKASMNSRQSSDSSNSAKKVEKEKLAAVASSTKSGVPCVVCQKPSRKNSIYCSEACILTHAHKIERVVVFERATGKMLTGNKAPSAANLDQWLKQHPGYEVVRSGGKVVTTKVKPGQFTQSKLKLVKNSNDTGVSLAVQQRGVNIGVMKHTPKNSPQSSPLLATPKGTRIIKLSQTPKETPKVKLIQAQPMPIKPKEQSTPPIKKIQVQTMLAPILLPGTPVNKTPRKEVPKKETPKEVKPKTPKTRPKEDAQTPTPKAENIRDNVQKTVFEQLTVRLKDSDIGLTEEEVKNISIEIEAELYKCFGDTGQKYKNKYRSLIFNIKDPKNQTLWRRICEKSISSYELVRLSPDDMASQELAKWREQEAKHQLDMIKKSEIELLNCNRQYVLKTHKGEEVLEDKRVGTNTDNIDIIKSLTEGSTLDVDVDKKMNSSKDRSRDKRKHKGKDKDRTSSRERRERSRRSSSKDRSRKRSRSKDRSKGEKKKREKRSRSRSRSREKSREREKNKDKDKYRKSSSHKSSRHKKQETISSTDSLDKRSKEILEQLNKIAPPVEEDKLWKHVPQEDIVPGNSVADSDSDHEVPSSTVTIPTPPRTMESEDFPSQSSDDSKISSRLKDVEMEENRPLSPPVPSTQLWSGTINMVDVAKISITAHEVSGDCTSLDRELSENLDIVGRISPDTVWEYIGKMRSSNSKVISLIRLNATNLEEQMPYLALYSYLSSRNRLGVVKSTNKAIKDFYILPLAAQKPIPQALLPINGPGFEEARPALLLGIIVRDRRKRPYMDALSHPVTPHKKHRVDVVVMPTPPSRSYTPPPVPPELSPAPPPPLPPTPKMDPRLAKRIASPAPSLIAPLIPAIPEIVPAPTIPRLSNLPSSLKPLIPSPRRDSPPVTPKIEPPSNDDDEPYSPEDSDPEAPDTSVTLAPPVLNTAISITQTTVSTEGFVTIPGLGDDTGSELSAKKMDIQRQMEELNKQIELQKSEITSITKNIATAESEIVGSALASIALPSNLQQILDSIKTIGATSTGESSIAPKEVAAEPESQSDLTIPLMIPKSFNRPLPSTPPQDTIPLNLPIKPKLTPPLMDSPKSGQEKQSVLSSLSEEDLIKKAAEMLKESEKKVVEPKLTKKEPKPPKAPISFSIPKRPKIELSLPPVPGVDD